MFFLLYLLAVIFIIHKGQLSKRFLNFLILPVCLSFSATVFLLFMVKMVFFHMFVVIIALVLYLLLFQYYLYFNFPHKYQPYTLESLSFYVVLLTFFFSVSSAFASLILLKLGVFLALSFLLPVTVLILYEFFWVHKISWKRNWPFVVILSLLSGQFFLAVSYLPTGYYVNSFLLTVCLYMMLGISRLFLQKTFEKNKILKYLTVGGFMLAAIMLTANWT